jgi:hypothetical protein
MLIPPLRFASQAHDVRSNGAGAAHATYNFLSKVGSHLKKTGHRPAARWHYLTRRSDSPYGVRVKIRAGSTEPQHRTLQ